MCVSSHFWLCDSWGCVRGSLEGEAKLCVTPVVNQALSREVLMHVSGPVQPPSLQLKSTQVIQLFCDINFVNVLVIVCVLFDETVEDDQQTARRDRKRLFTQNSSGQFWRFTLLCRGEFSCPFGLSTSQLFRDEPAGLVPGGSEQAEPDVLLLLPECDEIQTFRPH